MLVCYTRSMALTKKDKQFIMEASKEAISEFSKEIFQPQMTQLRQEMKNMERSLWAGINGLKIYMETQFRNIDNRFKRDDHENRITNIEHRLP